jgi:outer membrane protein TolC
MKRWIITCVFFAPFFLFAQVILTIDDAIKIALDQNFGIKVTELQEQADAMQVYKSNVGMGPTVDWNAGFNTAGNNVNQNFTDGRVINRWGRTLNPNTNVSMAMTLYDGGRMQTALDRLGLLSELTSMQSKLVVQNTIVDVIRTYYNIARFKETVGYLNTIIQYYDERLKITEERWTVGKGSKIDYLQSKADLNNQMSELTQVENDMLNAKVVLNGLMNRDPSQNFETTIEDSDGDLYQYAQLLDQAKNNNPDILLLQKSEEISRKQEESAKANLKPQVFLDGSAGFNYNNTTAGFLLSNRTVFANAGVTARWNLYDGNNRKNQIAIAKVQTEIIEKQQENLEAQIINDLTFAYNQYLSSEKLLQLELENKAIVEENLSISIEKFRLGGSTILELNETQRTYDTALNRLVNAQYNLRISELELLRLSGSLVE